MSDDDDIHISEKQLNDAKIMFKFYVTFDDKGNIKRTIV